MPWLQRVCGESRFRHCPGRLKRLTKQWNWYGVTYIVFNSGLVGDPKPATSVPRLSIACASTRVRWRAFLPRALDATCRVCCCGRPPRDLPCHHGCSRPGGPWYGPVHIAGPSAAGTSWVQPSPVGQWLLNRTRAATARLTRWGHARVWFMQGAVILLIGHQGHDEQGIKVRMPAFGQLSVHGERWWSTCMV